MCFKFVYGVAGSEKEKKNQSFLQLPTEERYK